MGNAVTDPAAAAEGQCPAPPTRGVGAHRGGARHRPENTLAAFRHAGALGVHQIELDVRASADGELFVIHDATVDRTTNGRGEVATLGAAELRALDAGRGERVPTLREALDAMPRDVWINVQIKRGEPIAAGVARTLIECDRVHQVVLACGNRAGRAAREVDPSLRLCNMARQRTRAEYLEHALETRSDFVQFHYLRGPMEPELVDRAHDAGLRVNFFCPPRPRDTELAALFEVGVDFVLVDDVTQALAVARGVGIEPLVRSAGPRR